MTTEAFEIRDRIKKAVTTMELDLIEDLYLYELEKFTSLQDELDLRRETLQTTYMRGM